MLAPMKIIIKASTALRHYEYNGFPRVSVTQSLLGLACLASLPGLAGLACLADLTCLAGLVCLAGLAGLGVLAGLLRQAQHNSLAILELACYPLRTNGHR